MIDVRLTRGAWSYDPDRSLGEGGFGEVFRGQGPEGEVAVKLMKVPPQDAAREIRMASELAYRALTHVVPALDWGRDDASEAFLIVMPLCDGSLADLLEAEGPLDMTQARSIAVEIVDGLIEVEEMTHRDLKPGNVLRWDGRWAVSDFGIAKMVAESTSLDTLRDVKSAYYAAPEQWREERPTQATDVYALGCILHAMINGAPPFVGDREAVRNGHLHREAPPLSGGDARLSNFVRRMLSKDPESRPDLHRCRAILTSIGGAAPVHSALLAAAGTIAAERATREADAALARTAQERRDAMIREAVQDLSGIFDRLCQSVAQASDDAAISDMMLVFGRARLTRTRVEPVTLDLTTIEIAAWCSLKLEQVGFDIDTNQFKSFGATLAFARVAGERSFRWTETGYWDPTGGGAGFEEPFSIMPDTQKFIFVETNVLTRAARAYGPLPIDGEDEEAFAGRWLAMIARAAKGTFFRPGRMPLPEDWFSRL